MEVSRLSSYQPKIAYFHKLSTLIPKESNPKKPQSKEIPMVKASRLFIAGVACATAGLLAQQTATVAAEPKTIKQPNVIYFSAPEAIHLSKRGKEETTKIQEKEKTLTVSLERKQDKMNKDAQEYMSKKTTMSSAAKEKAETSLLKAKEELEVSAKTSQQELQLASARATEELSKDIEDAARRVRKEHGAIAIVDLYTGRVVDADEGVVVTKDLVKTMDRNYEIKLASGKTPAKAPITVAAANKGGAAAA